jgi:hypothetical protein
MVAVDHFEILLDGHTQGIMVVSRNDGMMVQRH